MTQRELEILAKQFVEIGAQLRALGDAYPLSGCNAVLLAANMAASYADRAALLVEDRIADDQIRAIAMEELPCVASQ